MSDTHVIGFDEQSEVYHDVTLKKFKKSGGFQSLGLSYPTLKGILKRGYKVPTPIQRKSIPVAIEGRDVVAMARTGSGKTGCFLIPMFEKLKEHNGNGTRALILSPTRELAVQTLKFIKELGKFTNLKASVILGGDPMDAQFSMIHSNPDVIVATPGRLLHLIIEMNWKLNSIEYVVFDEADRLFEMGFSEQLTEIMQRLPDTRQTLLFSATLPKVLVQFAKAGLNDPVLIRLDVESKIPNTLQLGYFYCRPEERDAALLCIIKHVIKKKDMTIVFAATKHHVEFIHQMLNHVGISNTYIYSDLDPMARKINAGKFQNGGVRVLVVTDVAARGIDIPQLDNVVNYNFPAKPKLFVHRVGRCARAGRSGQAYSIVTPDEICYLLDLHLFLGRPLVMTTSGNENTNSDSCDCHFGKIPQSYIEEELSELALWADDSADVAPMQRTCVNGYKNYVKSRPAASKDSVRRSKTVEIESLRTHPLFANSSIAKESEKQNFISRMKNYKPAMTIFELGQSANSEKSLSARLFRKINKSNVDNFHRKKDENKKIYTEIADSGVKNTLEKSSISDLQDAFSEIVTSRKRRKLGKSDVKVKKTKSKDEEYFISYRPSDEHTERGLAGKDLTENVDNAVLDLMGDTGSMMRSQKHLERKWDPKKKKYVVENNKEKKIKSESGQWIPATYKTDKYQKWQERTKMRAEQDEEEDDPENNSSRPKPDSSMRLDTHWGRHNRKKFEKQFNPLVIDTRHILKQRKIKEKRRMRNGRKTKNSKIKGDKKKSAQFKGR